MFCELEHGTLAFVFRGKEGEGEKRKEKKRKENFWERSHTIQPLPLNAKAQENTPEVGPSYIVLIKLYIIIVYFFNFL